MDAEPAKVWVMWGVHHHQCFKLKAFPVTWIHIWTVEKTTEAMFDQNMNKHPTNYWIRRFSLANLLVIWATLCFEADERTNKNKSHINTKNMGRRKDGWARCSGCPEWAHSCSGKQLTSDQLTWLLSSTWAAHGLETSSNLKETKKQTFRFNCMFFLSNCNQLHVTD